MSMHPDHNYFAQYKANCNCFVETGTMWGGGVTLAVQAGFMEIYSIDVINRIDPMYHHEMKNYHFIIGDSAASLRALLPKLEGKKLFCWLDAHSDLQDEEDNFPLMRELEELKDHADIVGVIMIDDFLYMSHPSVTGWTRKAIEKAVMAINPAFKISYLSNPIKNNILLAK